MIKPKPNKRTIKWLLAIITRVHILQTNGCHCDGIKNIKSVAKKAIDMNEYDAKYLLELTRQKNVYSSIIKFSELCNDYEISMDECRVILARMMGKDEHYVYPGDEKDLAFYILKQKKMENMLRLMMKYKIYKEDKCEKLDKIKSELEHVVLYKDYEKDSSYLDWDVAEELANWAYDDPDEYYKLNNYGITRDECRKYVQMCINETG